ncbi:MAG: hypothetical protein ACOCP4_06275 [Candidatus Woesearchaeota archaeon]
MGNVKIIKEKLNAWGIRQQWLADKLGVHKVTLSLWLTETQDMPEEKVREAKKILSKIPLPEE